MVQKSLAFKPLPGFIQIVKMFFFYTRVHFGERCVHRRKNLVNSAMRNDGKFIQIVKVLLEPFEVVPSSLGCPGHVLFYVDEDTNFSVLCDRRVDFL